jgi:glutathione synthase
MGDFSTKMIGYFNQAIELYKASMLSKFSHSSSDPWVLFVVESVERNVID